MVYEISHAGAVFGLHTKASPVMRNQEYQKLGKLANRGNVLGWIPIAGIVVGISRLIFANYLYNSFKKDALAQGVPFELHPEHKAMLFALVARGIVETFSLGFLLLIPDLIVTLRRQIAFSHSKPIQNKVEEMSTVMSS